MGVVEIAGFAICWLVVASLMLWGVFTEHRRGGTGLTRAALEHPSRFGRVQRSSDDWVLVDQVEGGTPEVASEAKLIAGAWLASRGVDMEALPPTDLRVEVSTSGDGASSTTRVLVRSRALSASRRRP